jgi:hypothetical protein
MKPTLRNTSNEAFKHSTTTLSSYYSDGALIIHVAYPYEQFVKEKVR